jgi:hypothetical protein
MALPVLDGNQSATTLSSVVTGGEHIVAHSVVSLGSVAISNITSAVSGSVVSVSNFPASQSTTFGAVTGSVSVLNLPSTQTIAGTVTANDDNWVLLASRNWYEDQSNWYINVSQYASLKLETYGDATGTISDGDWTYGESGSCSNDVFWNGNPSSGAFQLADCSGPYFVNTQDSYIYFTSVATPAFGGESFLYGKKTKIDVGLTNAQLRASPVAISGTVNVADISSEVGTNAQPNNAIQIGVYKDGNWDGITDSNPFPVSGTVTANNPNGALTTRFGSVTTANTAQITSAVTNTNRKYLLAQNISAGTVTIGIGFSPTTTQGIQLTAGGGLTFDAFCPTGAVYWLGAVTGAAFTILEG